MFKVLGVLAAVFGRKGGSTAQADFEVADAAFVRKCQEVHGYTPVRLPDGGWAHPTWVASMKARQQDRSRR